MKSCDINIRDPFILVEDGVYYLYGTRAKDFGTKVGGFDVYTSTDLENWSEPIECFNSADFGLNRAVNWAPEVHKYKGSFYMFATFTNEKNLRGTHILKADNPKGPFKPHSNGAVTPNDWMSLDGTLYISRDNKPYIVFCHEHVQIVDGTICYAELSEDLTHTVGEVVTLFSASSPIWADKKPIGESYVTDGPFLYRTKADELIMIWSTFIEHKYAECMVRFNGGEIGTDFEHLYPLIKDDGGHGMIFKKDDELLLTFHTPNKSLLERPSFKLLTDKGTHFEIR
ncbi:MAG: family 43 glycosylhydrolase [Clostridia bacterium]|nr:family 43 glycosylhydrolase [Clostridia bacterium]